MSDHVNVYNNSALIHTGLGQFNALVLTCSSTTPALATFYDNTAGSGTKVLEVYASAYAPVIIFFSDRFSIRFVTGLYVALAANLTLTVWSRQL